MITVENAVKNASEVLYNISFSMPPYEEERTGRYYLLEQRVFASALDKLQNLDDTCTKTTNIEFNKVLHKVLGTNGAFMGYYYKDGTRFMDRTMYFTKFLTDLSSLCQSAEFLKQKYLYGVDCYMVLMENKAVEVLQIPKQVATSTQDELMFMPFRMFKRNEPIRVKRVEDWQYTCLRYDPSELLSTLLFTVENGNITCRGDNSKWEDSAWGL